LAFVYVYTSGISAQFSAAKLWFDSNGNIGQKIRLEYDTKDSMSSNKKEAPGNVKKCYKNAIGYKALATTLGCGQVQPAVATEEILCACLITDGQ
jgi:hypothetical protein